MIHNIFGKLLIDTYCHLLDTNLNVAVLVTQPSTQQCHNCLACCRNDKFYVFQKNCQTICSFMTNILMLCVNITFILLFSFYDVVFVPFLLQVYFNKFKNLKQLLELYSRTPRDSVLLLVGNPNEPVMCKIVILAFVIIIILISMIMVIAFTVINAVKRDHTVRSHLERRLSQAPNIRTTFFIVSQAQLNTWLIFLYLLIVYIYCHFLIFLC